MAEKKPWTSDQDQLLHHLLENGSANKWSHLARQLADQCGTPLRSGKECRERYLNQIEALSHKQEWNRNLEQRLVELHNEIGNKWAVIGHRMGGIDNSIKNHFYSLLRRALRKLNSVLQREHIKEIKDFKPPILYRIVQVADQRSRQQLEIEHNFAEFSHQLKNDLLDFSFKDDSSNVEEAVVQLDEAKSLINKVSQFITTYKKRGRRSRKNSGNNLLGSRKEKSRRMNEEVSESEEDNELDDIFPQAFPMFKNGKTRKQSSTLLTSQAILEQEPGQEGVRTRSRSHGNSLGFSFVEKSNYDVGEMMSEEKMEEERVDPEPQLDGGNISHHLEIQAIKSGFEWMEEEPKMVMKKKNESYLFEEGGAFEPKMDLDIRFFDDSPYQMRVLPEIEDGIHPEVQMQDFLK